MTWVPLTIRSQDDGTDATMHPVPVDGKNAIAFDRYDGEYRKLIPVTGLSLVRCRPDQKRDDTLMEGSDLKIALILTESRAALVCSRYDKGGGWRGDPVTATVLNGLSKTYAAIKIHRKSMVGHVRYPWLRAVGCVEKTGWLSSEALRLHVAGRTGASGAHSYLIDLSLPKKVSAKVTAAEMARLAARFRIATGTYSDDSRPALDALLDPPDLAGEKKHFVFHELPGAHVAGESTAYGERPRDSAPTAEEAPTVVDSAVDAPPEHAEFRDEVVHSVPAVGEEPIVDDVDVTMPRPPVSQVVPPAEPASAVDFELIGLDGSRFAVNGAVVIGRDPAPPEEYPNAAPLVVIDDMSVTKTHAVIGRTDGRMWVYDCYSTNGVRTKTPVDVDTVSPGWPHEVDHGVVVELGHQTAYSINIRDTESHSS